MLLIKYILITGFATYIHYTTLILLVENIHMSAGLATTIGATLGASIAYLGNHYYTFKSHLPHRIVLPRFMFVVALGAFMNCLLLSISTALFGLHYLQAQFITTAVMVFLAYGFNLVWTFKRK